MVSYHLCSVFTNKKLQFIDLLLEMELAILQLNVHPKVVQHLEPVPHRLGSVACSRSLVVAPAVQITLTLLLIGMIN